MDADTAVTLMNSFSHPLNQDFITTCPFADGKQLFKNDTLLKTMYDAVLLGVGRNMVCDVEAVADSETVPGTVIGDFSLLGCRSDFDYVYHAVRETIERFLPFSFDDSFDAINTVVKYSLSSVSAIVNGIETADDEESITRAVTNALNYAGNIKNSVKLVARSFSHCHELITKYIDDLADCASRDYNWMQTIIYCYFHRKLDGKLWIHAQEVITCHA